MQNNSYLETDKSNVKDLRPMLIRDDEIDLKELVLTLWHKKWLILSASFLSGLIALVYALTTPEVWTSSVKVMEPRINDFYQLSREVNKFQPVFSERSVDDNEGNNIVSSQSELSYLVQPEVLFKQYIDSFNSSINKRRFLANNDIYNEYLTERNIDSVNATLVLDEWMNNIQALPEDKRRGDPRFYTLSFASSSQQNSYVLLQEYSRFIADLVNNQIIQGINNTIDAYKSDLIMRHSLLKQQAKHKLELEKKKAQVAIDITSKAAIDKPFLNYSNSEIFPINLGRDANVAKKESLNKNIDLSLFEPDLITIKAKLNMLDKSKEIHSDISFSPISYIDDISLPLNKDKPKRALIIFLGFIFGGMLSIAFILVRKKLRNW